VTYTTMVKINTSRGISAPLDLVWDIIYNRDGEPRYWQGLNAVDNVSKKGNVIERKVTVGLRDLKGRQTVVLYPMKSIELVITEGPMVGTRIITLIPSSANEKQQQESMYPEMSSCLTIFLCCLEV
jgi:hypothetical protein